VVPGPRRGISAAPPRRRRPWKLSEPFTVQKGRYRIVTGDVQNHVRNNNINMRVSNENLGGTPPPTTKRNFMVIYRKQGREYGAHLEEGSWFIITD
jgi:hypothetical protein